MDKDVVHMNKIKNILIGAISVCMAIAFGLLIVIVCQVVGNGDDVNTKLSFAIAIFGIVSGIGSFVGVLNAILSILDDRASNIRSYYESVEKDDIAEARHLLYKYRDFKALEKIGVYSDCDFDAVAARYTLDDKLNVESKNAVLKAASKIANFYQMWGLLYKNGSLPIWVFKTSAGYNLLRLYDAIEDIIKEKQKDNVLYANEFIDLCNAVKKKYKVKLEPSTYENMPKKENAYPEIES